MSGTAKSNSIYEVWNLPAKDKEKKHRIVVAEKHTSDNGQEVIIQKMYDIGSAQALRDALEEGILAALTDVIRH